MSDDDGTLSALVHAALAQVAEVDHELAALWCLLLADVRQLWISAPLEGEGLWRDVTAGDRDGVLICKVAPHPTPNTYLVAVNIDGRRHEMQLAVGDG